MIWLFSHCCFSTRLLCLSYLMTGFFSSLIAIFLFLPRLQVSVHQTNLFFFIFWFFSIFRAYSYRNSLSKEFGYLSVVQVSLQENLKGNYVILIWGICRCYLLSCIWLFCLNKVAIWYSHRMGIEVDIIKSDGLSLLTKRYRICG